MSRADLSYRVESDDPAVHAAHLVRKARLARVPGKTAHQVARSVALAAYNEHVERRGFLTLVLNEIDRLDVAAEVGVPGAEWLESIGSAPAAEPAAVPLTRYKRFMEWVYRPADRRDWIGLGAVSAALLGGIVWWLW